MKHTLIYRLVLVLTLIVFLGLGLTAAAKKGGGSTYQAKLTIDDIFPGGLLFSDGNGPYVDWRLADDPDGADPCVKSWVKKSGFFFIYTNRGSNLGAECEQNYPEAEWRRYVLKFPADICSELGLGDGPCEVTAARIRSEKLFQKRAKETSIAFMFHHDGVSYSLDTIGDITVVSGDKRTLTNYTRTAQLRRVTYPGGPIGSPFVFPFQLTVERFAQ